MGSVAIFSMFQTLMVSTVQNYSGFTLLRGVRGLGNHQNISLPPHPKHWNMVDGFTCKIACSP